MKLGIINLILKNAIILEGNTTCLVFSRIWLSLGWERRRCLMALSSQGPLWFRLHSALIILSYYLLFFTNSCMYNVFWFYGFLRPLLYPLLLFQVPSSRKTLLLLQCLFVVIMHMWVHVCACVRVCTCVRVCMWWHRWGDLLDQGQLIGVVYTLPQQP